MAHKKKESDTAEYAPFNSPVSPFDDDDDFNPNYQGAAPPAFEAVRSSSAAPHESEPLKNNIQSQAQYMHAKKVSFNVPASNDEEKKHAELPISSVSNILDEMQHAVSTASHRDDPEYAAMHDFVDNDGAVAPSIFVPSAMNPHLSIDSMASEDELTPTGDADRMRNKYKKLKERYTELHKTYKKTKKLRMTNDKLVSENQTYEQQIHILQQQVTQQKNTIIRQNEHLLGLQSERDNLEDAVEEQLQEKRYTERYGRSPLLMVDALSNSNGGLHDELDGSHVRSSTTPLLAKTISIPLNGVLAKNTMSNTNEMEDGFAEDSKFTVDDLNGDVVAEDEEEDEEQKYPVHAATPGGPADGSTASALDHNRTRRYTKQAKFVDVDDITPNVERRYYGMSRSVLTSEVDPGNVEKEWLRIIGEETDDINIVEQSSEICDAWDINECECVQRILFVLKYYSQWLNYKAVLNKKKVRGRRDVFKKEMELQARARGYTPSITEFLNGGKLKYYNHVQLLNDFFHIKQYHLSDANQHEHVFKHFVNEFGFCDVKHCASFRRNHREKSFFGHHNRFRRRVYHLESTRFRDIDEYDEHEDNVYELHEINAQQCLDMIHSTLIHDYHNTTTDNLTEFARQLLKSPNPNADDTEYSYTGTETNLGTPKDRSQRKSQFAYPPSASSSPNQPAAAGAAAMNKLRSQSVLDRQASPVPTSPQQEDPESLTLDVFAYGFGVRFSYWIRQWPDFVQPAHSDLRSELLGNDIYRISAFEWDLLQHRAAIFMQSNHGLYEYLSKFKGSGNELMKIAPGSRLSINHLIALYTYTNYPNIRISFQKACLRTTPNEDFVSVRERHKQIAHWARLLYEAVYLFGCRMEAGERYYHILRSKIMLTKFSANLSCPTTMIANRKIVNNSNIVMEVENAHSRGATYLDISYFSDVPNREERLFNFGDLAFDNIILKGKSHRHYIKSLTLFQKIVQGSYFSHTPLKKKVYQKTIVHFIDNLMRSKDYGGISNYTQMLKERKRYNDEDIIAENEVPLYMQHLFDYFCSKIKTIWINQEEFSCLNPTLQKYLAKEPRMASITNINELILMSGRGKESMMGKFTKFLHFEYSINFKYCNTLRWEINGNALKQFWKGNKIFGQEFRVSTIRLFPYCVKDSSKSDGQFRFGIPVKSMPKYLKKIEFRVDLYIPEINYTFSAYSCIDERGTYWYSLFDSSTLHNFDQFSLRISFRLINLMVSSGNNSNDKAVGGYNSNPASDGAQRRNSPFPYLPKLSSSIQRGPSGSITGAAKRDSGVGVNSNIDKVARRISKRFSRAQRNSTVADNAGTGSKGLL